MMETIWASTHYTDLECISNFVIFHVFSFLCYYYCAFNALILLVGWQEGHLSCKKLSGGVPLTVYCFSKIQVDFTFLLLARPSSPGQRAIIRVCVLCY